MKRSLIFVLSTLLIFPVYAKKEGDFKPHKKLPPGLVKKYQRTGQIPPGWQKKLRAGEYLERDMYETAHIYGRRYGDYTAGAGNEILRIGHKILRIKRDTREILDILEAIQE